MKIQILIPMLLALIGAIMLIGGASAYSARSTTTAICEACGMEIVKDDPSTLSAVSSDGHVHYGCCPVCALAVGIYYQNSTVGAKCFACGQSMTFTIRNGNLTSISPIGAAYNISMVFGAMCMKNKIVCSTTCASSVKTMYDWAADLPIKTSTQAFSTAKSKLASFTVGYKPVTIPNLTYGLIISGLIFLASAPISGMLLKRRFPTRST
jgi:hypothetical protein